MNGARSAHVELDCALCSRCMCLISAFICCATFPVHPFTSSFSAQVKNKVLFCTVCPRVTPGALGV